jgi:hypothetical protein
MPTKRTPINRNSRARITPELRAKIERLVELDAEHLAAIRGDDHDFYKDGRHEEEVNLIHIVYSALGIRPWDDADAILQTALTR